MKNLITKTNSLGQFLADSILALTLNQNEVKSPDERFFYFSTSADVPNDVLHKTIDHFVAKFGITTKAADEGENLDLYEGDEMVATIVITNWSTNNVGSAMDQGIRMTVNNYDE
jgi:hypothetical protein